ncbi:unnamed protein product [Heterobilharzia americana]|nr:unnamed protein product [Heterobilharzia americana]
MWSNQEHVQGSSNVDLDAADNSESEFSLRSFSTSGVSSLMPRSWGLGSKTEKKVSTPSRLFSDIPEACSLVRTNHCDQVTSLSPGDHPKTNSCPPRKRQRLTPASSHSPPFSYRPRIGTTYGGAASCRTARELFEFTTPLRFELSSGNKMQSKESSKANLSSTARRILETLENLSTPLTSGFLQSGIPMHTTKVRAHVRSHRFPPFFRDYEKMKNVPKESETCYRRSETLERAPSQTDGQSYVSPEIVPHTKEHELVRKRSACEPVNSIATSVSGTFHEKLEELSPKYTFADPIRKFSRNDAGLVTSFSSNQKYAFSCPSRSCSKCPSRPVVISKGSSVPRTTCCNVSPVKSRTVEIKTWRCETCLLENSDNKVTCEGCSLPKSKCQQQVQYTPCAPSMSLPEMTVIPPSNSLLLIPQSTSKWECSTCMVFNEKETSSCVCCQTQRPLSDLQSSWDCPTCMVQNDGKLNKCPCCSTNKPGTKPDNRTFTDRGNFSILSSQPPSSIKFGFSIQKSVSPQKSEVVTANNTTTAKLHPALSNKITNFALSETEKLPVSEKQPESRSCISWHSRSDVTSPRFIPLTQSLVTTSFGINTFGQSCGLNAAIGPDSSFVSHASNENTNVSCSTDSGPILFPAPNSTDKTPLFSFGSCLTSSGFNGFTHTPPASFSDRPNGGVFHFGSITKVNDHLTGLNTSIPQLSTFASSNQNLLTNTEVRKKAHAIRRLRR